MQPPSHSRLLMTAVPGYAARLGLGFPAGSDESCHQLVGAYLRGLAQARLDQGAAVRVEPFLDRLGMGIDRIGVVAALRVVTRRRGQRLLVDLIEDHPGAIR